jgi:hypothetical protein
MCQKVLDFHGYIIYILKMDLKLASWSFWLLKARTNFNLVLEIKLYVHVFLVSNLVLDFSTRFVVIENLSLVFEVYIFRIEKLVD